MLRIPMKSCTAVAFLLLLTACFDRPLPPLVSPLQPRRSLDAEYTRLRLLVGEALDRTGVAGGVVDTGSTGAPFKRVGGHLIVPDSEHDNVERSQTIIFNIGGNEVASGSDSGDRFSKDSIDGQPFATAKSDYKAPQWAQTDSASTCPAT